MSERREYEAAIGIFIAGSLYLNKEGIVYSEPYYVWGESDHQNPTNKDFDKKKMESALIVKTNDMNKHLAEAQSSYQNAILKKKLK